MKLCYVLPQYFEDSAENFFHIVNFLEELGKNIELYVVIEHSNIKPKISNLKKIYVLDDGLSNISIFYRFIKLIRIYFELYNEGVNIFFARSSLTGVFPLIIANRILNFNRTNIIFWSCGQDVVPLSYFPTKKNFKRLMSKILAWFAFNSINYIATGPKIMVDYYHQKYKVPKAKILNLYNDISLKRFHPLAFNEKVIKKRKLLSTNKKVMLFVHTFNKCRGADILSLIAKKIKADNLNILVVAIGRSGDYSLSLDKDIDESELQDFLINLGQIANKDIQKYYQVADLFIMPSRGEGFPRVLLEAMASGCPAISFNVGGVANIIPKETHDQLMIPINKDQQFITKSISLISNKKLLENLSKKSYHKVKKYETSKVVDMYIQCLTKIEKK